MAEYGPVPPRGCPSPDPSPGLLQMLSDPKIIFGLCPMPCG